MKFASIMLALALILPVQEANACVGKTLIIGIPDSNEERLLAELVAVLVNERTGTTVNISVHAKQKHVFDAVKQGKVGILIENTDRALRMLGQRRPQDSERAYTLAKAGYRERFNLVWLQPFGLLGENPQKRIPYTPVISVEVMRNYPALPRVINKLSQVISGNAFERMITGVRSGKKPKDIARDYLRSKRLI
jgi:glycine betaine/choline ABC-type transport system substrate-binding protein